jgi:diguanylate cyclase (GGDEF)-like protein
VTSGFTVSTSLVVPTCVLDSAGRIEAVNDDWLRFADANGGDPVRTGTGVDYVAQCTTEPEVAAGVKDVLARSVERYSRRYPCHSPHERRWFQLDVTTNRDGAGAVVRHVDVTGEVLAHRRAERLAREQAALRRVATAVAEGEEPAAIHQLVAFEAAQLLDVRAGGVTRLLGNTWEVTGAFVRGTPDVPVGTCGPLVAGGELERVAATRRPVRVDCFPEGARSPAARAGYRSFLMAPVVVGGEVWGAVSVGDDRAYVLPADAATVLGDFAHLVSVAIKNAQQRMDLTVRAATDGLTGLANHRTFHELLRIEAGRAVARGTPLAVILLDLNRFKSINDRHGHQAGDRLLVEVAARLREATRVGDVLARVGGDEFALVLPGCPADDAERIMRTAQDRLAQIPATGGHLVTVSVGIATLAPGGDPDRLIERASAALVAAKGRLGAVVHYRPDHDALVVNLQEQREGIEALLADPERLTCVFQPIAELATGRIIGYEALTRFSSPVPREPEPWFAQAHRCGLGAELEALAARRALSGPRPPNPAYLALNFSPSALLSDAVAEILPADLSEIVIELTEHELITRDTKLSPMLDALRARGARIAIDDAGAGYAGLTQLMRVRPDLIKLDRSLVGGIHVDPMKAALVESFVGFARRIGAALCAEGIETLEELRALADMDVTTGQGYCLAHPGPPWPAVSVEAASVCRDGLTAALVGSGSGAPRDKLPLFEAVSRRLAGAETLDQVADVTGDVGEGIGADEVWISVWDVADDAVATIGRDAWAATGERFHLRDYPATRGVLEQQRALVVHADDPDADPSELAFLRSERFRSVLLVPIIAHGRTLGLLEAYTCTDRPWARGDIQRARLVCNQLGAVIESHAADPSERFRDPAAAFRPHPGPDN